MSLEMPSPFGHALAGAAIGFACQPNARPGSTGLHAWAFPLAGALMAALPDADLLLPHFHRTATHSLTATFIVIIVTMAVTRQVTHRIWWGLVLVLGAAHSSHLLLDWLGADPFQPAGFQLLWPFRPEFYISGLDWFPPTERRLFANPSAFTINLRAFVTELTLMGPLAVAAWWFTRTRRSRGPTFVRDIRRPPSA